MWKQQNNGPWGSGGGGNGGGPWGSGGGRGGGNPWGGRPGGGLSHYFLAPFIARRLRPGVGQGRRSVGKSR